MIWSTFYEFSSWQVEGRARLDVRVFFIHPDLDAVYDIADRLDEVLKERRPDAIVLAAHEDRFESFIVEFNAGGKLADALERAEDALRDLVVASYRIASQDIFVDQRALYGNKLNFLNNKETCSYLLRDGLESLANRKEVVTHCPPGCVFEKPSGRLSEVFIRAQALFQTDSELSFVCFNIAHRVANTGRPVDCIYIDTMSIHSVAASVARMLSQGAQRPRVVSFGSYDGLEDFNIPLGQNPLFLISASTSGSLPLKLKKEKGAAKDQSITLIDTTYERDASQVLIVSPVAPGLTDVSGDDVRYQSASRISIVGEFFSTSTSAPREVVISSKHNRLEYRSFWIKERQIHSPFKLKVRPETHALETACALDAKNILSDSAFIEWVERQIRTRCPVSVKEIVYLEKSDEEIRFADQVAHSIEAWVDQRPNLSWIEDAGRDEGKLTVVVVSLGGEKLKQLVNASRILRDRFPEADRLFLTGPLVSLSEKSIEKTKADLCYPPPHRLYQACSYAVLGVGLDSLALSWRAELRLIREMQLSSEGKDEYLSKRERALSQPCVEKPFNISPIGKELLLSKGFAFWAKGYTPRHVDPNSVLFTIARILQNARENDALAKSDQLQSKAYQAALIAPRVFDRFSDGIIQASILRAAEPRELRYDLSEKLSREMGDFLRDLFESSNVRRGEAAVEFAFALATGWLRISGRDMRQLSEAVLSLKESYLDLIKQVLRAGDFTAGFEW